MAESHARDHELVYYGLGSKHCHPGYAANASHVVSALRHAHTFYVLDGDDPIATLRQEESGDRQAIVLLRAAARRLAYALGRDTAIVPADPEAPR